MKKKLSILFGGVLVVLALDSVALAQTASQDFTISVTPGLSITAPDAVSINHDQTDDNQTFPAQTWIVKSNAAAGVSVTFATQDTFKHSDGSAQRNASISLAVKASEGPGVWTVTTPVDQTDYANNDQVASVTAESNGIGRADLDVTLEFVTEEFGLFAAGDYTTTVVGTITAN